MILLWSSRLWRCMFELVELYSNQRAAFPVGIQARAPRVLVWRQNRVPSPLAKGRSGRGLVANRVRSTDNCLFILHSLSPVRVARLCAKWRDGCIISRSLFLTIDDVFFCRIVAFAGTTTSTSISLDGFTACMGISDHWWAPSSDNCRKSRVRQETSWTRGFFAFEIGSYRLQARENSPISDTVLVTESDVGKESMAARKKKYCRNRASFWTNFWNPAPTINGRLKLTFDSFCGVCSSSWGCSVAPSSAAWKQCLIFNQVCFSFSHK